MVGLGDSAACSVGSHLLRCCLEPLKLLVEAEVGCQRLLHICSHEHGGSKCM